MCEVWKPVQGFPNYQISSLGRIKSKHWGILKPFPFKKKEPYLAVDLMRMGKRFRRAVHQLVLEAFVGPRPRKDFDSLHKNGVADDNRVENLSWGSKTKNQFQRRRHGTYQTFLKLTEEQAKEIGRRYVAGEPASSIAKDFPITKDYVYRLCYAHKWRRTNEQG